MGNVLQGLKKPFHDRIRAVQAFFREPDPAVFRLEQPLCFQSRKLRTEVFRKLRPEELFIKTGIQAFY